MIEYFSITISILTASTFTILIFFNGPDKSLDKNDNYY
jgi:hypothetical protein